MKEENKMDSKLGLLHLESWAGTTKDPVEILKETPKRYKIRFLGETCFQGKFTNGKEYYVPKYAVSKEIVNV